MCIFPPKQPKATLEPTLWSFEGRGKFWKKSFHVEVDRNDTSIDPNSASKSIKSNNTHNNLAFWLLHCELAVHFPTRIVALKLYSSSWRTALLFMLSFLSCVGCRYCRFSPFASISFASHHTFRTRNCSKTRCIHQCQALLCSSSMIHIWDTHEDKRKDIISAPSTAKSAPNTAQRAHQRVQSLFF